MQGGHTETRKVELVIPGGAADDGGAYAGPWVAGGAAAVGLLLGILWWRWRASRSEPAEVAFRKLARRMGLTRAERRAIRKAAGGTAPVALLLSADALERAVASTSTDAHLASAIKKLRAA
jgi:hypothetical protein